MPLVQGATLDEEGDTVIFRIKLKPHWINGWFLRLFSSPVLVVGSTEHPLSWSAPTEVEIDDSSCAMIGVGIRYSRRGPLLGAHMAELPVGSGYSCNPKSLTFRNGLWNHAPFVLAE